MTRYLTARQVARDLATPWRELEPLFEAQGADVLRIGSRVRIAEADVERFVAASRQLPATAVADRAELVLQMALDRMAARKATTPTRSRRSIASRSLLEKTTNRGDRR